jgi:ABC-type multidrug transport system permease subunit
MYQEPSYNNEPSPAVYNPTLEVNKNPYPTPTQPYLQQQQQYFPNTVYPSQQYKPPSPLIPIYTPTPQQYNYYYTTAPYYTSVKHRFDYDSGPWPILIALAALIIFATLLAIAALWFLWRR